MNQFWSSWAAAGRDVAGPSGRPGLNHGSIVAQEPAAILVLSHDKQNKSPAGEPGRGDGPGSRWTAKRGRSPPNPLVRAGMRAPALTRGPRSRIEGDQHAPGSDRGAKLVAAVFVACAGEDRGHLLYLKLFGSGIPVRPRIPARAV